MMRIGAVKRSGKLSVPFMLCLNRAEYSFMKTIQALDSNSVGSIVFIDIIRMYGSLPRPSKNKVCIGIFDHKYMLLHFDTSNFNRYIMTDPNRPSRLQLNIGIISINAPANLCIDRKIHLLKNVSWHHINFRAIIESSENRKLVVNFNFRVTGWKSVIAFGIDRVNIDRRYRNSRRCSMYRCPRSRS